MTAHVGATDADISQHGWQAWLRTRMRATIGDLGRVDLQLGGARPHGVRRGLERDAEDGHARDRVVAGIRALALGRTVATASAK